jgi:hypothetical protein
MEGSIKTRSRYLYGRDQLFETVEIFLDCRDTIETNHVSSFLSFRTLDSIFLEFRILDSLNKLLILES